jgi:uncharacterized repeat protein (TIGR01451 family)
MTLGRRLLPLALLYALLLLGLASLNGELLALALPLAVYLLAALLYGPGQPQLHAARSLSGDRVRGGQTVTVRLEVSNEGADLDEVLVEDLLPPGLEVVDGTPAALARLPSGGTLELSYQVRANRGGFHFGSVRVTTGEPLGLSRRQVLISAPADLLVLPRARRLERVAIRPLRTRGYAGPVPARQGGSGTDFFGVREYQAGDPRRWINWRVSARHPRSLFTNEFEQERIADVGLVLDARSRSDVAAGAESLFEYAVQATASLAESFLDDGNRVGLLVYGRVLDWTFPGYGKVQRERILRALARARTGQSQVFDNLHFLPTRFFPAQSQLVLVSPLWPDDLPAVVRLRARGYQVLVIRPDLSDLEVQALGPGPEVALARRIARIEWLLLRQRLLQAGVWVVDWPVQEPLGRAVHASLGRLIPRPVVTGAHP